MRQLLDHVVKSILLLCLVVGTTGDAKSQTNLYSFFVAGHPSGWMGLNDDFIDSYPYIQNRPEIELGLFAGDMVTSNPDTVDWEFVDVHVSLLGIPVHFAPGNHDMENRPLFEYRYGDTYYSFEEHNDLFIVLDPNLSEWNIDGDQLHWLDTTLASSAENVDNIYVVFHQLLWREDDNQFANVHWNSPAGRADTINFWSTVLPLFESYDNEVVMVAGDVGAGPWASDVMYDSFNNITLIATGMGEGIGDNFVIVNVALDKTLSYDLVCISDPLEDCLGPLENHQPIITQLPIANGDVEMIYNSTYRYLTVDYLSDFPAKIDVYDQAGRVILSAEIQTSGKSQFEMQNIGIGLFTVVLRSSEVQKVERFAVTR